MIITVLGKRNVREVEEEVTVHSSSTAVKGHQMSVLSQVGVSAPDKSNY